MTSHYLFIDFGVYFYRVTTKNMMKQLECIIRNSSLPLLGGCKITRQDKEKHSIF